METVGQSTIFRLVGYTAHFRCTEMFNAADLIPSVVGISLDGRKRTVARVQDVLWLDKEDTPMRHKHCARCKLPATHVQYTLSGIYEAPLGSDDETPDFDRQVALADPAETFDRVYVCETHAEGNHHDSTTV